MNKKAEPENSQARPLLLYISDCPPELLKELKWLIGDIYNKGNPVPVDTLPEVTQKVEIIFYPTMG